MVDRLCKYLMCLGLSFIMRLQWRVLGAGRGRVFIVMQMVRGSDINLYLNFSDQGMRDF